MVSLLGKVLCFLFVFFFASLSLQGASPESTVRVSSYWQFQNSVVFYSLKSKKEEGRISHIGARTGLSYVKIFSLFSMNVDFSLLFGPYTRFDRNQQRISMNFFGFGGRVGLIRELDFIPGLKNFSLASALNIEQIKASNKEGKALKIEESGHLFVPGDLRGYGLKIRSFSLYLELAYHFSRPFKKVIEKKPETKAYGHSLALGVSFPFYSKWKENYFKVTSPSSTEYEQNSIKGSGVSFSFSYYLAFL